MKKHSWLVNIEDYAPLIAEDAAERIMRKAQQLRGMHVLHVSSTFYGGGSPSCSPRKRFWPAAWESARNGV